MALVIDMEVKYTTGDWMISNGSEIVSMPSQCKISRSVSGWNYEEAKANAKLISAAPNLLEALQNLIEGFDNGIVCGFEKPCECQICRAKAAIKKATE